MSGARAGTLAVMIGATREVAAVFEPVLRVIGTNLFYLGEVGRGNILKLLNNLVALTNQTVLCEAMALADRLEVPRETVGEVLGKSSGASASSSSANSPRSSNTTTRRASSWTSPGRTSGSP